MYDRCMTEELRDKLSALGSFVYHEFSEPSSWTQDPPWNEQSEQRMIAVVQEVDALIVAHGSPRISERVMAMAPGLRFVGELEGDRFAHRIDLEAAVRHGIRVVDTSHGSSDPVAEWALALMLIGLRNGGSHFRRLVAGGPAFPLPQQKYSDPGYLNGELTGKRVGLIACGHIGRRLIHLLKPFGVEVLVYDPYLPRELSDAYGITVTSLENVFTASDVVVCLAPLTSQTLHLIGATQLELLRPGAVFVNVSRGAVVDTDALVRRLGRGDIIGCLDVYDPEPIPVDSAVRSMPNVFLSPHIGGVTAACGPRFVMLMIDEIVRHFSGHETRWDIVPRICVENSGD